MLGGESRLDGMAAHLHLILCQTQWLTGGDSQLELDKIEARHRFRHCVLDLQPCIDLEEVAILCNRIDDKLNGADRVVLDLTCYAQGVTVQLFPGSSRETRRRRLLENLLVLTLDRTVPIEQVNETAVLVTEQLNLHVTGLLDILFDDQSAIAKRGLRLLARQDQSLRQLLRLKHGPDALATAAGRSLDEHRESDPPCCPRKGGFRLILILIPSDHRHARGTCQPSRFRLRTHLLDRDRVRPHPDQAGGHARPCQLRALGQKAVAGVDRLRPALAGRF